MQVQTNRVRLVGCAALAMLGLLCAQAPPTPGPSALPGVRVIYIVPMAGGFDQFLAGELLHRLPPGVTLTLDKSKADAVLQGTTQGVGGDKGIDGVTRVLNQATGVGGLSASADELVSASGALLWADEKSDHTIPVGGLWREHGVSKVAARIAKDLSAAIQVADEQAAIQAALSQYLALSKVTCELSPAKGRLREPEFALSGTVQTKQARKAAEALAEGTAPKGTKFENRIVVVDQHPELI